MKVIKTSNLIILNEEKTQVCLVKRRSEYENREKWAFPGESIKVGETLNKAMVRIIKEQMECDASNFKEFKKSETRAKNSVIKSQYLTGNIKGDIILDKRKYSQFKWFEINEKLLEVDYAFNEKIIVEKLLKDLKK